MKVLSIVKNIILENSRFDVLLDKYTTIKKDKEGKKVNPVLDVTKLAQIIFADPTTKKPTDFDTSDLSPENLSKVQPGAYTNWLLSKFVTPGKFNDERDEIVQGTPQYKKMVQEYRDLFMEDLFKVTDDLKKFTKYKQYFPLDKRDINKFSSPDELFRFLNDFKLPEKKQKELDKKNLKKEIRKERKGYSHPGATVEIETPTWTVVKISDVGPKGQEAASWYGGYYDYNNGESRWCTSPPDSSYFKGYAKDGPLYVILANDDKGKVGGRTGLPQERFQFHFPSNQFMDNPVDHGVGEADVGLDPAREVGILQAGVRGEDRVRDVAVALDVVAGHDREGGDAAGATASQRFRDQPEERARRDAGLQVVLDIRVGVVEGARGLVEVVAALGDREAHDARAGRGHPLDDRLRIVRREQVLDHRAEDARGPRPVRRLLDDGVQARLRDQGVAHAGIAGQDAHAGDRPVVGHARPQQPVDDQRLVRAVERAHAHVDDARPERRAVIWGDGDGRPDLGQPVRPQRDALSSAHRVDPFVVLRPGPASVVPVGLPRCACAACRCRSRRRS